MFKELESVPLFKDVDDDILHLLEPLFEPYACPVGTVIFEQGDPAHYLYLILNGSVELRYKPYDGPAITVTNLCQGNIFGWSAAIGNSVYTSGTVCKDDCRAIRISKRNLLDLCAREPEAGQTILNLLAESVSSRWTDAKNQIQALLHTTVSTKASTLPRTRKENR
jgi:CRP-like cAMP-binding protein